MTIQPLGQKISYSGTSSAIPDASGVASDTSPAMTAMPSSVELTRKENYELSISEKAVVDAINRANKLLAGIKSHVEFSFHKPHGDILVKVINSETQEVIREIPPEKIVDLIDKFEELNGKIIDEKR
ncbi:flagellar protein FlaG [Paenibacillus sp. y28]|uniref:flagellar protein FlaG n=1 Tax=Paenibacillus sp. y28 TaxID=3129110 RepID=UPI0030187B67